MASYIRREEDWVFQANVAAREIIQLDKQITSADIQIQVAEKELKNHQQQIENTKEIELFLKDKFTNQELYQWMKEQLFAVYKQSYNLAYDMAKKVEKAYKYETGVEHTSFIQYGYWDNSKQGLVAGEKLQLALRQLEKSYLEENVRELAAGLTGALVMPCDVGDDDQIAAVFAKIEQDFGGLDFLVHGAAFAPREELSAPFVQTSRAGFRASLDISAYSLIALSRGAAPLMERRGGGSILTLTYLGSQRVFTNYNVMGVAKAALEASVRYLAADLGPRNIRVNAISAGPIKTLAASGIGDFRYILRWNEFNTPLRRNVELGEVADTATFLLSAAARGITGEIVMVDAGFHIAGGA